ncbi:MAG TPA: secretin N-terminal domain-containing protein [Candidatus Didemnitutus sp.]|nr:secretin N-terminal domain-containing protein [Candidatus Didemnitutus sp.]
MPSSGPMVGVSDANTPSVPVDAMTGTVGPLKFGDLAIDAALDLLEQWTGRIILRTQQLPATSLVLSINHPIPKAEAVQALETELSLNQIGIAPMGDRFLKVTPLAQVRSEAPELIEGSTLAFPPSGRVAVKLFEFQYLTASEIMPQLATLLSPGIGAAPVVVDKANSALITDTIANLQRIERLIKQLDQPSLTKLTPHFYNLTNAKASDVANSIKGLLTGSLATQIGNSVTIQPDDRTNQLIILCDARQQSFFDQLIDKLNSTGDSNTRQEVIFLKHAVSKDIATLLTNLVNGRKQATQASGNPGQNAAQQAAAAAAARRQGPQAPGAAPVAPTSVAGILQSATEGATEFSTMLTIISEDRSNSLVVSGTVDDIAIIRELVNKIDVVLAQVRIDMLICEVQLDDDHSSGISALGLNVVGGKLVGFNGAAAGLSVGGGVDSTGASTGLATFGANHELTALIGLSTTPRKNFVTVLSQPSIVATHNQESTIFVGESDPVLSSYANNGTISGSTTTGIGTGYNTAVTYKDIGVQVKVKPLIGSDGAIELQISTEVNDIAGSVTVDGNAQPKITKRTTESTVSARDGEVIVLGGLQKKSASLSTSRLGPIPIIGDLLGSRTKSASRDDLVFFMRPYILTNTPVDNQVAIKRLDQTKQGPEIRKTLEDQVTPKPN